MNYSPQLPTLKDHFKISTFLFTSFETTLKITARNFCLDEALLYTYLLRRGELDAEPTLCG